MAALRQLRCHSSVAKNGCPAAGSATPRPSGLASPKCGHPSPLVALLGAPPCIEPCRVACCSFRSSSACALPLVGLRAPSPLRLRTSPPGRDQPMQMTGVEDNSGRPRIGGPDLWIVSLWCKEDEGDNIYPGSGPLEESDISDARKSCHNDSEMNPLLVPTYIAGKKAKHPGDSDTTPKSCLDVVLKLLANRSGTSSMESPPESVLQSQLQAERRDSDQLLLELKFLWKVNDKSSASIDAMQLELEDISMKQAQSHQLAQLLALQLPGRVTLIELC